MQLLRAPQLEVKNSAFFSPSFLHTVCVFFFFRVADCIVEKEKKKSSAFWQLCAQKILTTAVRNAVSGP